MELEPKNLQPEIRNKILTGCVVPRPIALVSTVSPNGEENLAPFSYFNAVGHFPMALLFCVGRRPDLSEKDSLRNARFVGDGGTGEFVVNVAVETYAPDVAAAAEPLPEGESEFELTSLTPVFSKVVRPPRVAESPVAFECRTTHIVPVRGFHVVIGEVVHVFIQDDLLDERFHIDADKLGMSGHMAGATYCRTRDRFELGDQFERPIQSEKREL